MSWTTRPDENDPATLRQEILVWRAWWEGEKARAERAEELAEYRAQSMEHLVLRAEKATAQRDALHDVALDLKARAERAEDACSLQQSLVSGYIDAGVALLHRAQRAEEKIDELRERTHHAERAAVVKEATLVRVREYAELHHADGLFRIIEEEK